MRRETLGHIANRHRSSPHRHRSLSPPASASRILHRTLLQPIGTNVHVSSIARIQAPPAPFCFFFRHLSAALRARFASLLR